MGMNLKSFRSGLLTLGIGVALTVGLGPAIGTAQTTPRSRPAIQQAGQALPAPPQSNRTNPRGIDRRERPSSNEDQPRGEDEPLYSAGREDRFRCQPLRVVELFGENFYGAFDGPFGPYTPCYDHRLGVVYYP
jgi:hypothetical protein